MGVMVLKGLSVYEIRDMALKSGRSVFSPQQLSNLIGRPKPIATVYMNRLVVRGKGVRFNSRLANAKLKYYKMRFSAALFANAVSAKRAIYMKELKGIVFDELPDFSEAESALEEWTKA